MVNECAFEQLKTWMVTDLRFMHIYVCFVPLNVYEDCTEMVPDSRVTVNKQTTMKLSSLTPNLRYNSWLYVIFMFFCCTS